MDESLEWLTQNTEDPKSNKRNLTFPTRTHSKCDWTVKYWKSGKPPPPFLLFLHQPPPFQVYPPFLAKIFISPPSDSIFGRSYPFNFSFTFCFYERIYSYFHPNIQCLQAFISSINIVLNLLILLSLLENFK